MSRFLVIDSDGPRVEGGEFECWLEIWPQPLPMVYADRIKLERLRYIDLEAK